MEKKYINVVLMVMVLNMSGMAVASVTTPDSLTRTTPGQAALVLSKMNRLPAAGLVSQMHPGIVAQIVSPNAMRLEEASAILNETMFCVAARILAPALTMPDHAVYIWKEMARQTPNQENVMNGMNAAVTADYLVNKVSSRDAAKLLYSRNSGVVASILASMTQHPKVAQDILTTVVTLSDADCSNIHQILFHVSEGRGRAYNDSAEALGVNAGSLVGFVSKRVRNTVAKEVFGVSDTHCAPGEHCISPAYCPQGGCVYSANTTTAKNGIGSSKKAEASKSATKSDQQSKTKK
ncbi:hypothetical protein KBD08_02240 [Candidatus Babeliales bacterium]|nr:hypothetical protein [Candidatus Babeliales bacterium]